MKNLRDLINDNGPDAEEINEEDGFEIISDDHFLISN
jgi:hypothetical protein